VTMRRGAARKNPDPMNTATKTTKITAKEAAMLLAIANSEYRNDDLHDAVWSFDLGGRGAGGVIASLIKKGLIWQSGKGTDEAMVGFTETGIAALPADVQAKWKVEAPAAPPALVPVIVSCCREPRVLGGKCDNCGTWTEDLLAKVEGR
jgi:hypothetical protein